jgi:hypothetical protein
MRDSDLLSRRWHPEEVATAVATRQLASGSAKALQRTSQPGVYRRGRRYVSVYRREGRQRKESAASFAEARAIKLAREAEARAERLGPTLHDYTLRWVATHAGLGHNTVSERTRREYRRLLITFALRYFSPQICLAELDREALQGFVTWLTAYRDRLADRSKKWGKEPHDVAGRRKDSLRYEMRETYPSAVASGHRVGSWTRAAPRLALERDRVA